MDDFANKETERILAELERKIKTLYADASRDMKKKAEVYFARFAERDKKQKAALDAGRITEEQYRQWRLAQIGRGERFEKLRDELADRMTNANQTAAAYINDQTPGIYSLNHNYEAYTIEKVAGNVGFTIYDEQTVRRLIQEDPNLLPKRRVDAPKDKKWNRKLFSAEITSGILQGESIGKLANRVQNLSDANRAGAIRNARTAVTGAQNGGRQASYERAKEMGLKLRKRWIATKDMRTRHAHAMLDGQTVELDKPFEIEGHKLMFPGDPSGLARLVWNCRCTMRTVEKDGIEAEPRMKRVVDSETGKYVLVSDMTYAKWAGWKKEQAQRVANGEGIALNGDKYAINPKDINGVTRGEAMSFEDADGQAGNPKYRKGTGTAQNCQSCVIANEARRRGYNVSAQSYTKNKTAELLSRNPRLAWVNPETGDVPDFVPWDYKRTYDKKSYKAFLDENVKAGERYTLQFNWSNASGGHIISADRDSRGGLRLYDPQTGKIYDKDWSLDDLMGRMRYTDRSGRADPPKLLRVDNLAFREDVTKNILEEGARTWTPTDDPEDWIPF